MDRDSAVQVALDAVKTLDSIRDDVSDIKQVNAAQFDLLRSQLELVNEQMAAKGLTEVEVPSEPEAQNLIPGDPANWVTEVRSEVEVPADFFGDLMSFQYMQTVLLVFLLAAFLLNLGATLWLAFSDKWRS